MRQLLKLETVSSAYCATEPVHRKDANPFLKRGFRKQTAGPAIGDVITLQITLEKTRMGDCHELC